MYRVTFFNTQTDANGWDDLDTLEEAKKQARNLKRRKTIDAHSVEIVKLVPTKDEILADTDLLGELAMMSDLAVRSWLSTEGISVLRSDEDEIIQAARNSTLTQPEVDTIHDELIERSGLEPTVDIDRDENGDPAINSIWLTKRNGDFYRVVEVVDGVAKLRWLEGSYSRKVPVKAFPRNYIAANATWGEGFDLAALRTELA